MIFVGCRADLELVYVFVEDVKGVGRLRWTREDTAAEAAASNRVLWTVEENDPGMLEDAIWKGIGRECSRMRLGGEYAGNGGG